MTFLSNLAHAALPSVAVLYMGYRYNWDTKSVGLLLAGVGVCQIIVQGLLVGRVVKALGERQTLLVGLVCGAAGFTVQAMAPNGAIYASGIVLMSLWGLMSPALQGLMTRLVSPSEQGQLQGANSSVLGIATLIGPLLFTQTFASFIGAASRLASARCAVPALGGAARRLRWQSPCASWRAGCNACRPRIPDRLFVRAARALHTASALNARATRPTPSVFAAAQAGTAHALKSASLTGFNLLTKVVDHPPEPSRMQTCAMATSRTLFFHSARVSHCGTSGHNVCSNCGRKKPK